MRFHPADAPNYDACVVLGNGGDLDRLPASFWDRLTEIQQKCSHEALTIGVNRLGCCEAAVKHGFMPDVHGLCDAPRYRPKTAAQSAAESVQRQAAEKKRASIFRAAGPTAFEEYELMLAELERFRASADAAKGLKTEMVLDPISEVFMQSHRRVAGVALRVVSDQARAYPHDYILNTDRNVSGPADRSIMLFTTTDWLMNWLIRLGFRGAFFLYGQGGGKEDGQHCRVPGFAEPDDYSWTLPSRQSNWTKAWGRFRAAYPDADIRVPNRRSFLVTNRIFPQGSPEFLAPGYEIATEDQSVVLSHGDPAPAPPPARAIRLPHDPPAELLQRLTAEIQKQKPSLLPLHAECLARNLYRERYADRAVPLQEVPPCPTSPPSPASTEPSSEIAVNEPSSSPCAAVS